jgi:hypothetical protein
MTSSRIVLEFEGKNLKELLYHIKKEYGFGQKVEEKDFSVFTHTKYFKRINMEVAGVIVFHEYEPNKCRISVWGAGGVGGWLRLTDWGTEDSIRDEIVKDISDYAEQYLKLKKC